MQRSFMKLNSNNHVKRKVRKCSCFVLGFGRVGSFLNAAPRKPGA